MDGLRDAGPDFSTRAGSDTEWWLQLQLARSYAPSRDSIIALSFESACGPADIPAFLRGNTVHRVDTETWESVLPLGCTATDLQRWESMHPPKRAGLRALLQTLQGKPDVDLPTQAAKLMEL